jgi:hypothetical protein
MNTEVKIDPSDSRSVVGNWRIDGFPDERLHRSIELVAGKFLLVSRFVTSEGQRVGGDEGLLLERITESEYRGTPPNRAVYRVVEGGALHQLLPGENFPTMTGTPSKNQWPD